MMNNTEFEFNPVASVSYHRLQELKNKVTALCEQQGYAVTRFEASGDDGHISDVPRVQIVVHLIQAVPVKAKEESRDEKSKPPFIYGITQPGTLTPSGTPNTLVE